MTVTLAMLVRDPQIDRLAALLEYVKPVVGQVVIVVDDRTSQRDRDFMASWGAELVPFTWCDDFSAARNAALTHVKGDWTLMLDPDELPTPSMMAFLAQVDASEWGDVPWYGTVYYAPRGYLFWRANYFAGVRGEFGEDQWHCRLFRSGLGAWYRPVHELVLLDGRPENQTRNTPLLPKAPRSAYLIHSKPEDRIAADDALYGRLAS
jgi:glycosyltransferase involved in cell wall biosynthesis